MSTAIAAPGPSNRSALNRLMDNSDVAIAIVVVWIVVMMIIQQPTFNL